MGKRWKTSLTLFALIFLTVSDFQFVDLRAEPSMAIMATIPVGVGPKSVAVDAVTNKAYVGSLGSSDITVIDAAAKASVATVPLDFKPAIVAVSEETNTVYVATYSDLYVIDGSENKIVAALPSVGGDSPIALGVDSSLNRIYLMNWKNGGSMVVIDGSTNRVVDVIETQKEYGFSGPNGLDVDPGTHQIYVTEIDSGALIVINGTSLRLMSKPPFARAGTGPIVVDRKLNRIFALYCFPQHQTCGLNVLDASTYQIVHSIQTTAGLLREDQVRGRVYLLDSSNNTLIAIDGRSDQVIDNLQLEFQPGGMDLDRSTGRIYVTDPKGNNLVVLSTTELQTTTAVSTGSSSSLGPQVPGFPIESILIGIVVGLATLVIIRRSRRWSSRIFSQ